AISESAVLKDSGLFEDVKTAGPGFINFYLDKKIWQKELERILRDKKNVGRSLLGKNKKIHMEFISANPTGPLHVGHGRGAVLGDVLANLYEKLGYTVWREYYVNDYGNQVQTLGESVKAYVDHLADNRPYTPEEGWYQGDYIKDVALRLFKEKGPDLDRTASGQFAAQWILKNSIEKDLASFGVKPFDRYFSEKSMHENNDIQTTIEELKKKKCVKEEDGALWFLSRKYGDEKDRVIIRKNGLPTYLASDITYHQKKFEQDYQEVVNIWGADHHGYIQRVKGSMEALGFDSDRLKIVLVQMVNLKRGGVSVKMSKRSGEYITLKDVIDEVGADAARFTFLTRRSESHLDFDLDLVKSKSMDNPVFYLQYAYARTCNIFEYAKKEKIDLNKIHPDLDLLNKEELSMIKVMSGYEEILLQCVVQHEPYYLVDYLLGLAKEFHSYYNKHRVITQNRSETETRLCFVNAIHLVLEDALNVLGVQAPRRM
ncbi:arginine--tRNA ligase, partial [PVC group bacterium]|nr:arginine--tRNA ligase [PVC group bacterium]